MLFFSSRFLLCGQTTTDVKESDLSLNDSSVFDTSGPDSSAFSSSYGSSPRKMSLVERMSSVEASGDLANREGTSVAITVIQVRMFESYVSLRKKNVCQGIPFIIMKHNHK